MDIDCIDIERKYNNEIVNLALDTLKLNKQALIFVNTKRSAEKCAEDISLKLETSKVLQALGESVLKAIPKPTKQCERLSKCMKKGTAFHHAGLTQKQRELIEDNFRKGNIKIICCTPTLCISGDTKVWHGVSETEARNLRTSSRLFALSGCLLKPVTPEKVEKVSSFSRLLRISSVSGHSIKVTANHRMLIKRAGKKFVVPAGDVRKTDKIATIGRLRIGKTREPSIGSFVKDNKTVTTDIRFDSSISYFVGAMLGDGYSGAETQDKRIVYKGSPSIVGIDEEIFSHIRTVCSKLGISCRRTQTYHGTPQLVLGKNNWFREFLVRCGVEKGDKKHISERLMCVDQENIAALLRGLFDTDGFVQRKKEIGFSNISNVLIRQIQKSLLRFGIVSRIRKRKAGRMHIYDKEYDTSPHYELLISHKTSIVNFYRFLGFNIRRKEDALMDLVSVILSNLNYVSCPSCNYKVYKDIFSGRTAHQKSWGKKKLKVIELLGKGERGSREIKQILGFEPRKNDSRLNHHYELLKRRRISSRAATEQVWGLNPIGKWVFKNILGKGKRIEEFFRMHTCPLCQSELSWVVKKGWQDKDVEGDIFWDVIREIESVDAEPIVYDVVLPRTPKNNHMFVAEGFIVHNSAGVDLPAFRTIIRDLKRYSSTGWGGMQYIPVLEYLQMAGRAGRPSFDTFGEAICLASSEQNKVEIREKYIFGEPEEIYSKLAVEPVLRTYILSLIASDFVRSKKELIDFFSRTFWAFQFRDMPKLEMIIDKMLDLLERYEFIISQQKEEGFIDASDIKSKEDGRIRATLLGRRVAQLYLDPITAHHIIKCIRRSTEKPITPFGLLQMCCNTLEMRPLLRVKTAEFDKMNESFAKFESDLLQKEPSIYEPEYDEFLASVKTAFFFLDWINERDEEFLYEEFDIRPGEIRVKIDRINWLLYSAEELTKLMSFHEVIKHILKLRFRVKYGVREELLTLLKLKGIGRIRARKLFNAGIRDIGAIKKADLTSLSQLIGKAIALDIKKQVGENIKKMKVPEGKRKGQLSLGKYAQ